jgi:hypothetical protein
LSISNPQRGRSLSCWSEVDAPGSFGKLSSERPWCLGPYGESAAPHLAAHEGGEVTGNDESAFLVDHGLPARATIGACAFGGSVPKSLLIPGAAP